MIDLKRKANVIKINIHLFEAARYHYHLSNIFNLIERVKTDYKPTTSICFVLEYPVYREVLRLIIQIE